MNNIPKRRKDKYNKYKFKKIEKSEKYIIEFEDYSNNKIILEISNELYSVFNTYELIDLSIMNEFDRHIEHSELNENTLNKRKFNQEDNIEDIIISKFEIKKLHKAINLLPVIQKDRIKKYFFNNMTQNEIAIAENCSIRAIQYSLKYALNNLKKFLDETS